MNTLIIILIVVSFAVLATNVLILMNYAGLKKSGRKSKGSGNTDYGKGINKTFVTNHS